MRVNLIWQSDLTEYFKQGLCCYCSRMYVFQIYSLRKSCAYIYGHMYLYPSGGGQIGPTISIDRSKGCIDQGKFSHWCLCYVQFLWIHFAGISYISDHTLMYTRPIKLLLDSSQHFIRPLCLASNVSCATDTTFSRISLGTTS